MSSPALLSPDSVFEPDTAAVSPFAQDALAALWSLKQATGHERITDDEQGVLAAMALCLRADCTRRRVACIVVDAHGRVLGAGRNGAPPGRPGCLTAGACPRGRLSMTEVPANSSYATGRAGECIAVHAELNALLFSDPVARRGGVAYVTDAICDDCSKHLAGSGLARTVWPEHDTETGGFTLRSIDIATAPIGGYLR